MPRVTRFASYRCTLLGLLLLASSGAFANNAKISPDLQPLLANSSNNVNVIVQYSKPQQCFGPAVYFQLSGTSMATPVVSGAAEAGILLQHQGSPDTVKARLMQTATKNFPLTSTATDPTTGMTYVSTYDIFTVGAGYVEINAALGGTAVAQTSAESPSVLYNVLDAGMIPTTTSSQIWGSNAVWGTNAVWGSSVLTGTNAVWGSSTVWSSNAVWGSSTGYGEE